MKNSIIKKIMIIAFWLICWEALSYIINNNIVLVGPIKVIKALIDNALNIDFYLIILNSAVRIIAGFLVALILGIVLGAISYKYTLINEFFNPLISVIKSVPVVSFVVLLLIWAGSANLSFFISFLIVFPQIYISIITGLNATDKDILKMANVFKYSIYERAFFIYKDSIKDYLLSAVKTSFGLSWKSGVAAEVIGMSAYSIGNRIYSSKIYLDTASLFAWTLVVALLSYATEKLTVVMLTKTLNHVPKLNRKVKGQLSLLKDNEYTDIDLSDIYVKFDDKIVLDHMNISLKKDEVYVLSGPSGIGKTTLLKEIYKRSIHDKSVVFQEDRLLNNYDGLTNILLGNRTLKKDECINIASKILDKKDLFIKIGDYSGGMKRRVAILRALLASASVIIMDEPFTGLDTDTKKKVISVINEYRCGRLLIVVSHDEEDVHLLGAQKLSLVNRK